MIKRNFHYRFLSVAVALALAGCSLSPDYIRPAAPVPDAYPNMPEGQQSENTVPAADLGWRQFFQDPQLKALIELASGDSKG
jgi:multidrug efflux system outer membrane protein